MGSGDCGHMFRCAFGDNHSATVTTFRAKVNNPVGGLDHIHIMLDDDHRVALVYKLLQHLEQLGDVMEM